MNDKNYLNTLGSYFHRFSRSLTAKGQEFIDQAPARTGHNISYTDVRAEIVPPILNISQRRRILENIGTDYNPKFRVNSAYKSMIKFYQKMSMTEIPNTNGESWRILDKDGIPAADFISPTDVLVDGKYLSDGYAITLYDEKGEKISQNYGWEFDYYSGILTFHTDATPLKMGWGIPKIDAFQYIGKHTIDYFEKLEELIKRNEELIQQIQDETIAVQRFKFSSKIMIPEKNNEGEIVLLELPKAFGKDGRQLYTCNFTIKIEGYVFETISLDLNDTIIAEIHHDEETGDSIIICQLIVDETTKTENTILPIIDWTEDNKAITGHVEFLATTFKRHDGRKIDILPEIDLDKIKENI